MSINDKSPGKIIEVTSNVLVICALVAAAVVYFRGHTGLDRALAGPQRG